MKVVLNYCPESTEVCDGAGSTLLHLLSQSQLPLGFSPDFLLNIPAIKALKNQQDNEGNTAAHIAVENHNVDMILMLLHLSVNFAIKNKKGVSAADLMLQLSQDIHPLFRYKSFSSLSCVRLPNSEIDELDFHTILLRFKKFKRSFLQKKGREGNILHTVLWTDTSVDALCKFTEEALQVMPSLICELNDYGFTPLHIMVERKISMLRGGQLLDKIRQSFLQIQQDDSTKDIYYIPPWIVKDAAGNTPLHLAIRNDWYDYLECAKELLKIDEQLADEQNNQGETPLHLITKELEWGLPDNHGEKFWENLKYMIKASTKVINKPDKDGLTPLLIAAKHHQLRIFNLLVLNYNLYFLKHKKDDGEPIEDDLGDLRLILTEDSDPKSNTFWHLLANIGEFDESLFQQYFREYISYPILQSLRQSNKDGKSPLHLAIECGNFKLATTFKRILDQRDYHLPHINYMNFVDNDGKTILHVAAGKSYSQYAQHFITSLVSSEPNLIIAPDKGKNTSLHIAILEDDFEFAKIIFDLYECSSDDDSDSYSEISISQILKTRDRYQNTPLHLAILQFKSRLANFFLDKGKSVGCIDEILDMPNQDGNTPLHLSVLKGDDELTRNFIERAKEKNYVHRTLRNCNEDGDTPLHLAIRNRSSSLVKMFIEYASTASCLDEILDIPNKYKQTSGDMIGSAKYLPDEFDKFCWNEPKVVQAMLGVRSLSGVSTEVIEQYTNTIGVTAALLATITFTASFTVPGGLNQDNGTPLLMRNAAFKMFMVADVLAMCLAMMVLFCLLWIMTIANKKHRVILLDITVFLLEAAFYATIFTFMMGLYATVSSITLWIAILTCVLSTLLILLMHKGIVIAAIPFFVHIYVRFRKLHSPIGDICGRILCGTNPQTKEEGSGNTGLKQAAEEEDTQKATHEASADELAV